MFAAVAHPNDLATVDGYRACVDALAGPDFTPGDLFGYLVGDSPALSCAAAEALGLRDELRGREAELVKRLDGISVYARHFLLPTIARSSDPATSFAVLLLGDNSWGSAMGMDLLRGYLCLHLDADYAAAPAQRERLAQCAEGHREWMKG
ncbi:MAG: hypothetical protein FJ265_22505, partial [Planctomycetes bacterium]|nr:hypothetical protein [Planctomycetota bacterium]